MQASWGFMVDNKSLIINNGILKQIMVISNDSVKENEVENKQKLQIKIITIFFLLVFEIHLCSWFLMHGAFLCCWPFSCLFIIHFNQSGIAWLNSF